MPYRRFMKEGMFRKVVALRRRIHRWPEPAFQEHRTAKAIATYLDRLGVPYEAVAGTGVVARLEGTGPAPRPTVALRADMDALPIAEKTGLPFASRNRGYMHACGHDGHVATLMGALELMLKDRPAGDVVFLFQPAEEGGAGALRMIEGGALAGVDMVFGGHIDVAFPLGTIAIRPGVETAYTDALDIRIVGKGGHAARPHETVDAVLVSCLFVIALQNIVSRGVDPLCPTVLTIGSLHAGTVYNAIASEATLQGTVRNTDPVTRRHVLDRIRKTAQALGALHDAAIEVEVGDGYPPVINSPEGFALARETAEDLLGKDKVATVAKPSMGGEDFAYYVERVPGCFVRFGAVSHRHHAEAAHSPFFDFDEDVIRIAAAFYSRLARRAHAHLSGGLRR
jgi:hippurate hydrolase